MSSPRVQQWRICRSVGAYGAAPRRRQLLSWLPLACHSLRLGNLHRRHKPSNEVSNSCRTFSPLLSSKLSHIYALTRSCGTPKPLSYKTPRLYWALASPCSARGRMRHRGGIVAPLNSSVSIFERACQRGYGETQTQKDGGESVLERRGSHWLAERTPCASTPSVSLKTPARRLRLSGVRAAPC